MKYYDVHLHLPSADREGVQRFVEYAETADGLVGGNLILNTPAEVEAYCRAASDVPRRFTAVPYYRAPAEVGVNATDFRWWKVHPRLRQLTRSDIPRVVEDVAALKPVGVIVDCFPWGPELEHDVSLELVIALARSLANTSVLVAHGGGYHSWAFRAHTVSLKNTLYDFSASLSYYVGSDVLRPLQNYLRFVPRRVLFGSDWPFVDPAEQLTEFERLAAEAGFGPHDLEATLLETTARLWPNTQGALP